jgi:hypothetical protein
MKTDLNGLQLTILKQYRQQSTNFNDKLNRYYDLFKVQYSSGKIGLLCQTEINY